MAHRSLTRDILEAKMAFNPEKKAALMVASPHRRHKIRVAKMAEIGERMAKALAMKEEAAATPEA